jgi:glycine/D-amino acid oxidase-like deaminating enzyme
MSYRRPTVRSPRLHSTLGSKAVIVSSGIVGASAVWALAELGQPDVLVVDQGPLFETGGSTLHSRAWCSRPTRAYDLPDRAEHRRAVERLGEGCWYGVSR